MMYKWLKNIVVVISVASLTVLSILFIRSSTNLIPSGNSQVVNVQRAKSDILVELGKIARDNNVIIAKQILTGGNAGKVNARFEQIGTGKLPSQYQKADNLEIRLSPNTTNFIIIGKGLSAKELASELNQSGNLAMDLSYDLRFSLLKAGIFQFSIPLLILVLAFSTLLLAEYVSSLKMLGLKRLSGISKWCLAFSGIFKGILFIFFTVISFVGIGGLYLALGDSFDITYWEILGITVGAWGGVLVVIYVLVSLLIYYILQSQPISLSVKGKVPLTAITVVIIVFQSISIIGAMKTVDTLNMTNQQISLLNDGLNKWREEKSYYGTMILSTQANSGDIKNLVSAMLNDSTTVLAVNPFMNQENGASGNDKNDNYLPTPENDANIFYVNQTFLIRNKIKISDEINYKIKNLSVGEYAILIPNTQTKNTETIATAWESEIGQLGLTSSPVVANYQSQKDIFAYSVMGTNETSNRSFTNDPIFIVYSGKTFENVDSDTIAPWFMSYLSSSNILFTNPEKFEKLVHQYNLDYAIGSPVNGYFSISDRLSSYRNVENVLLGVNIGGFLSLLVLATLLNTIYFYQNRRNFLIEQLSGKSLLKIHYKYLSILTAGITMIIIFAYFELHAAILSLLIPIGYLVILLLIFGIQLKRSQKTNILYLKGL